MGAVVHFRPGIPAQRMVPAHVAASGTQAIEVAGAGSVAAERIHDDAYLNPCCGPFRQRGQYLIADLSVQELIGFEIDCILRSPDGLEISRVKLDSVLEPRDVGMPPGAVGHEAEELYE